MKKIIITTILTVFASVSFAQTNSGVNDAVLQNAMNKAQNQKGDFNSMVPNPFVFCSGKKPKKGNPLRAVWNQICPSGNAQATAAPVAVPMGTNQQGVQALRAEFEALNQAKP